jgi:hypothetical protein
MYKYFIEQINVSDTEYKIIEISKNVLFVKKGDFLFSYESSKATFEVFAEDNGYLYFNSNIQIGQYCPVGYLIAIVTKNENTTDQLSELFQNKFENKDKIPDSSQQIITKKAKLLIEKNQIDINVFVDNKVVNEEIVLKHLNEDKITISESNNQLLIIGGRGGAKMVIEAIRSIGYFSIKGIIDDTLLIGEEVLGVKVLGGHNELLKLFSLGFNNLVLSFTSLSDLTIRELKYHELKCLGFKFPNIIHRRATVEPSVKMGEGNIILANSMLGSDVILGDINFINTGAIISHDTSAILNNHFAPNSVLAGRIKIGKNNLFGMCSTVYFDTIIGNNNIIYNGVNVFNNIGNKNVIK